MTPPPRHGQPTVTHYFIAFVFGAIVSKVFLVRDSPTDETMDCGMITQIERTHNDKQIQSGQRPTYRPGSLQGILEKSEGGTVIISFASYHYRASMVNWMVWLKKAQITNFAIVCLDRQLQNWLQGVKYACQYLMTNWKHGVWAEAGENNCVDMTPTTDTTLGTCKHSCEYNTSCKAITWKKLEQKCFLCPSNFTQRPSVLSEFWVKRTTETLWYTRWKLLVRLLNANIHVLMTDLDAIFLRNPMPTLHALSERADVLGQRGTFPEWLSTKWGAAVCMGLTYWRATPATKRFTVKMNEVVEGNGDDQIGINVALDQAGLQWEEGKVQYAEATNVSFGSTPKGGALGLTVGLLPHLTFPRKCEAYTDIELNTHAQVAHCFEPKKSGDAKMKLAQKYRLWALREDWEKIPDLGEFNSFDEFLDAVLPEER
eukprot:Sspe_Gene.67210::Locus_39681_Transcript_3_7_Confidence_0.200_Length_1511::g.67210::m.67210